MRCSFPKGKFQVISLPDRLCPEHGLQHTMDGQPFLGIHSPATSQPKEMARIYGPSHELQAQLFLNFSSSSSFWETLWFFMELFSQKKTNTSKKESCVTHSSIHCLLREHGPAITKLPGAEKGSGSYAPRAELPLCTWKFSLESKERWGGVRGTRGSFPLLLLPLELCNRRGGM